MKLGLQHQRLKTWILGAEMWPLKHLGEPLLPKLGSHDAGQKEERWVGYLGVCC